MKFNHENRPKPSDFKGTIEDRMKEYIIADTLWHDGFEKELRKKLSKSFDNSDLLRVKGKFIIGTEDESRVLGNMEQAYRLAIKEILGE